MDLFLYFLISGISFWGLAIPIWATIYMMKKKYLFKQVLFVYICMIVTAIYYWSNLLYHRCLNDDLTYKAIAHIFIFVVTAIMIFVYKKYKNNEDEK